MTHKEYLELLIGPLANEGGGGGIVPSGSISITENGAVDVTQFAEAAVNVQPDLQAKSVTITENGTTSVAPDTGKDGLSGVAITVNVQSGGGATAADVINKALTGNFRDTGVIAAGRYAFIDQTGLTGVDLPNCVSVGDFGFIGCTGLKTVLLDNCTSFGSNVWDAANAVNLQVETLSLASLVTMNWGYGTFSKLTELYAPLLESIGDSNMQAKSNTASRNTKMKILELPSIKTLGVNSFAYFQLLQAVKFGPNIESIASSCFRTTNGLHAVIFDEDTVAVPSVGNMDYTFNGTNIKFYVPDALLTAWKAATNWNDRENAIFALSTIQAWTAGTYSKWDVVTNGGAYWISTADSNTEEPTTGATKWSRVGTV
jgi:hypothetical protein